MNNKCRICNNQIDPSLPANTGKYEGVCNNFTCFETAFWQSVLADPTAILLTREQPIQVITLGDEDEWTQLKGSFGQRYRICIKGGKMIESTNVRWRGSPPDWAVDYLLKEGRTGALR